MPRSILYIIDSFPLGGAEKLVLNIINEMAGQAGQHLIILSEPSYLTNQINAPCKITVLDFNSYRDLWRIKKVVHDYIIENKIDIIHSHLYWSNIIARMAAGASQEVFNTIHAISSEASYKLNRTTLYLEKITYKKKHHIIGVSGEVLKDFDEWTGLKGPSTVLYNFIDDRFFSFHPPKKISEKGLKLVAVGNLRRQKNYPYIIEVFKQLSPEISLDIYGEGEMRRQLQKDIDKYKLNIRLCGHHQKLDEILPRYDGFIMCSFYEGFSLGLMEAMACGLAPLLSDIPVLHEAAGESAVYYDLENPKDCADKINYILARKIILISLAETSNKRARELTKRDRYFQKLKELYRIKAPE